jgi:Uncharacterised nucleotidyltransferase
MKRSSLPRATNAHAISPEDELAFRLVATEVCRQHERDRINELAASVDYERLAERLERQRLVALVGHRLARLCTAEVPAAFSSLAHRRAAEGRHRFALHRHIARTLARRMETAGIEVLPLKGPLLAERIYDDPGLRASPADLDFLVRPDQLDHAVELMGSLGYRVWDETKWDAGLPHYHYCLTPPDTTMPKVELHWRIHWYEKRFASAMIERSTADHDGIRTPSVVDDLATLLIIFARDGFVGLRLAADIGAWWTSWGEALQENCLDQIVDEYPELRAAVLAALDVSHRISGLPSEHLVSATQQLPARARLASRLANWRIRGSRDEVATNITLIDLLLTPRAAAGVYVRHYYMSPIENYARDYGWRSEARLRNELRRAVHALARLWKSLWRYLARVWSIRGGADFDVLPARSPASGVN